MAHPLMSARPFSSGRWLNNGGDYLIPSLELRPDLGDPGATGFVLHLNEADAAG